MTINQICWREVETANSVENVMVIAERMHARGVGSLVVVNGDSEPIGMITDRDLVVRVLAKGLNPTDILVHEVMTHDPQTTRLDRSIESALAIMRHGKFRRLPVVNEHNKLIGLVTLDDILMSLSDQFAQIGQLLERETPQHVLAAML